MRSNIIQMLLNASSGKGGTSPGQPSSEWTIVHLFGRYKPYSWPIRGVTFKDKSGKYYYVRAAYDVTQTVPGHATNCGAYGFADLLPWQGATTAVQNLGSKETIDLETKDPNGRPKVICLVNALYSSDGLPMYIFNTDGSHSYLPGAPTSNSNYGKTTTLPGGSTDDVCLDTTIAIQVPPGQIVSITFWSEYDREYLVQDQSMTIEENVNNWKTIGYTKLDFSRDRLIKWVPEGSNCKFFSETDDFGLTISGKGGSEWTIVHLLGKYHPSSWPMRGVTFKDKSGKYYYVRSAYDVTQAVPGRDTNYGAYGFADLLPWQGATTAVTSLGSKETIDLETKDPNNRPKVISLINSVYVSSGSPRHIFNTDGSTSYLPGGYTSNSNYGKTTTLPGGSTDAIYSDTTVAIQVPPGQIVSITYWSEYDQFYLVQDKSMTIEENVNNWKMIGCTKIDFSRDRLMKWVPVGSKCEFFSETDDFGLTIQ